MNKIRYCDFDLTVQNIQTKGILEAVSTSLQIGKTEFPPKVWHKQKEFFLGGYLVSYERKIKLEEIHNALKDSDSNFFTNLIGEYFLVCVDKKVDKIWIITSPNGKFPCYFAIGPGKLSLSTNFSTVLKNISKPTLDIGSAMDYLSRNIWPSDQTVINQIRQLPPGYILTINNDLSIQISASTNNFFEKYAPYSSREEFVEDFLSLLTQVITEQVNATSGLNLGAELSSGFDSTLICFLLRKVLKDKLSCYSGISKETHADTDPQLVKEFAKKHDLELRFINQDNVIPFDVNEDLLLIKDRPSQVFKGQIYNNNQNFLKDGIKIKFSGDGGDEVYWSNNDELWYKFPIQEQYFTTVKKINLKIGTILSNTGMDILYDRERFAKKDIYHSLFSPSAVSANLDYADVSSVNGLWQMTPFIDQRLVALGRQIPRVGNKIMTKQDLFKNKSEIFPKSFFRPKGGPTKRFERFLTEKKDWTVDLLRNSELGGNGLVQTSQMATDIENGSLDKYFEGTALIFLINLLELEYFIKLNNISVLP